MRNYKERVSTLFGWCTDSDTHRARHTRNVRGQEQDGISGRRVLSDKDTLRAVCLAQGKVGNDGGGGGEREDWKLT